MAVEAVDLSHHGSEGFYVVLEDVTERDTTERLLAQAREQLRVAFEEAPVGMALLELNGRVNRVNTSFAEALGADPAELQGRTLGELTHADDRAADVECLLRIAAGEAQRVHHEKRFLRAESRGSGVEVMCVCPGWTHTEFQERSGYTADGVPELLWLDADQVVSRALADLDRRRAVSIAGPQNKVAAALARLAPGSLAAFVALRLDPH
jgi:PAS domain S-box-containing protein